MYSSRAHVLHTHDTSEGRQLRKTLYRESIFQLRLLKPLVFIPQGGLPARPLTFVGWTRLKHEKDTRRETAPAHPSHAPPRNSAFNSGAFNSVLHPAKGSLASKPPHSPLPAWRGATLSLSLPLGTTSSRKSPGSSACGQGGLDRASTPETLPKCVLAPPLPAC